MVLISVIIPCFNAAEWIRETLKSVISQEMRNLETIVIDDGSTDGSADIVEKEFPGVSLVRTKNQGASAARNLGTEMSKGEFIQYLDADDLLVPGKLKFQLEALKNSDADVAYGNWCKLFRGSDGKYVLAEEVEREIQDPEIDLFTDFWCPPAVYLFRRSIVERVGGWNENLPIIQDARFSLDCALRGGRFVYCQGLMAYYRVHSEASLSTRDSIGFVRDCLRSALQVEEWWQGHGGINKARKKALLKVYGYVARASFNNDRPTFESAYESLNKLIPVYIPEKLRVLRLLSRLLGYRRAEVFALWYRRIKLIFVRRMHRIKL